MVELDATATATAPARLSGVLVIRATGCFYPPAVSYNDLIRVDFDRRSVDADGLYLVEEISPRGVEWRGCRRFAVRPGGIVMDFTGEGDWRPIELARHRWRVAGAVVDVYRAAAISKGYRHG